MKNLLTLGKALNKAEQKQINGGTIPKRPCKKKLLDPNASCIPSNG